MTNSMISACNLKKHNSLGFLRFRIPSRDLNRWLAQVGKQSANHDRIGQKNRSGKTSSAINAIDDFAPYVNEGGALRIKHFR